MAVLLIGDDGCGFVSGHGFSRAVNDIRSSRL